jgi:hypothetical protein
MFSYLLSILFSLAVIFAIHWGFQYFQNTFTVKKTKNMTRIQSEKYDQILRELAERPKIPQPIPPPPVRPSTPTITEQDASHLSSDLDDFIKSIDVSI